jgi:large subunit ribosomal protein L25
VDLEVKEDGRAKRLALVKEVQHHPVTGKLVHVDFHEIAENEKVAIMVPVETEGEAVGVKTDGGVLEHVLFKIKVLGLPKDLPEVITVNVSHLKIGEAIHLGEIQPPPGTEIIGDKQIPVIAVAAPRTEEEEAAALAEAAAAVPGEVEMIKEKKEGEEEEGAPPAKGAEKGAAPAKPGEKPAPGAKGAAGAKAAPGAEKAAPGAEKKPGAATAGAPAAAAEKKPAGKKKK